MASRIVSPAAIATDDARARSLEQGSSISGKERNHLFLNLSPRSFVDISGISGLDHDGDGRAFAWFDYNRDGRSDLVVVNANAPFVQLFRNETGAGPDPATRNAFLALRLVGGNHSPGPSEDLTNRDGFGARIEVSVAGRTLKREHRAGEGFAAQNSTTLIVGLGDASAADAVRVSWPSGRTQEVTGIGAGTLVTVYEESSHSPTGDPFVLAPYPASTTIDPAPPAVTTPDPDPLTFAHDVVSEPRAKLVLYTTMATWCVPCRAEIPDLEHLLATFEPDELEIYGIPYDEAESPEILEAWAARYRAPYRILHEIGSTGTRLVKRHVLDRLKFDGVPAAIVTDENGHVLRARWGPPTVSELRELLEERLDRTEP